MFAELAHHLPLGTSVLITISILLARVGPRYRRWAWWLGLSAQILFIMFGAATGFYSFFLHALPGAAFLVNLLLKEPHGPPTAPATTPPPDKRT